MKDKRIRSSDRRLAAARTELPLVDDKGDSIKEERRSTPDRRLNNISVEELDCAAFIHLVANNKEE